jgi:hypothetical protein
MTENKKHKFQPVIILQEELPLELPIYITTRESLELFRTKSTETGGVLSHLLHPKKPEE